MVAPKKSKPPSSKATGKSKHADATALTAVTGSEYAAMPAPEAGKKRVLHVGCGLPSPAKLHKTFSTGEWQEIRMDIDPEVKPDIVADMCKMDMIADANVDAVWSSHNIEHLYAHEVPIAFRQFYRVIKEGGFVLITLPDIQKAAQMIAKGKLEETMYLSPAGPITPLDVLFGLGRKIAQGNHFMAHRTAFTAETLGQKLRDAGFCNIQVKRTDFDLWGVGYKLPEEHPNRVSQITVITPDAPLLGKSGLPDELDRPPTIWNKPEW